MDDNIKHYREEISAKCSTWLCVALLIVALLVDRSAIAAELGWQLKQRSNAAGDTEVYATPSGFKLVYVASGLTIVATPPSWKSQIFNPRKKTRYAESLKDMSHEIGSLVATMSEDYVTSDPKQVKVATYFGHKATLYTFKGHFSKSGPFTGEVWYATDIPVYKELAEYYSTAAMLPHARSVRLMPLEIKINRAGHAVEPCITKEIKPFMPPPHFFDVPPNYKLGKQAFDIAGSALGDFMEVLKNEDNHP
jgi:hypothetical protein